MNVTNESNQNLSNNTNNLFAQWNQGPPHYSPWGHSPNSPPASLVTFNAQSHQMEEQSGQNDFINNVNNQLIGSTSNFGHNISVGAKPLLHCKRKANVEITVPNKQHITEEKMAQHMSRLHISSETHYGSVSETEDTNTRQKRLYVCEEMRRLQTENILPTALLGRLERPCMAVMLWHPPAKIPELISQQNLSDSHLRVSEAMAQAGSVFPRPRNPQNSHQQHTHQQNPQNSQYQQHPQYPQHPQHPQHPQNLEEDENDNSSGTINLNNMEMDS